MYEGDGSARDILKWLDEGGYSTVLYYDGRQHAYLTDEDDDCGWQRVPVTSARELVESGQVAIWRWTAAEASYADYRPALWVQEWIRQEHERNLAAIPF